MIRKWAGRRSQDKIKGAQMVGQPIRSIRELPTPSLLVQVKPGREGNGWRQTPTQQQFVKSLAKATELSGESLSTHEPRWFTARSKTKLKSPARIVGTLGSTYVCTLSRKSFLCGFRFGAYKEITRKRTPRSRNSHWRSHGRGRFSQSHSLLHSNYLYQ